MASRLTAKWSASFRTSSSRQSRGVITPLISGWASRASRGIKMDPATRLQYTSTRSSGLLLTTAHEERVAEAVLAEHQMSQLVHQGEDAPTRSVLGVEDDHGQSGLVQSESAHLLQRDIACLKDEYASRF